MVDTTSNSGEGANMPKPDEGEAALEDTSVSEETSVDIDEDDFDDDESLEDYMSEDSDTSSETKEKSTDNSKEEEATDEFDSEGEDSQESEANDDTQEEDTTSTEQSGKTQEEIAQEAYKLREAQRQIEEKQKLLDKQARDQWLKQSEDEEELKARTDFLAKDDLITRESSVYQRELDVKITQAVTDLNLKKVAPEIRDAILDDIDDFERLFVVKDEQNRVREIKGDVYQYLQKKVGSYQRLMGIGAREQSAKKSNEKARTITVPTRTPKEKPVDPLLDAFDEEANSY
jgi:hypothetical protein